MQQTAFTKFEGIWSAVPFTMHEIILSETNSFKLIEVEGREGLEESFWRLEITLTIVGEK